MYAICIDYFAETISYNICVFTIGGIITEAVNLGSVVVSVIRFGINGFVEDINDVKTDEKGDK